VTVVLCSWSGRPARPRTQHGYHHDRKVKPEAATAVFELLMMGGRTPKTCWAVNKRQDNKLKNCCIWLVIYLNWTMMHGLTNLKFTKTIILLNNTNRLFLVMETWCFIVRLEPKLCVSFTLNSRIKSLTAVSIPNQLQSFIRSNASYFET
jgi:hypothetical protein